MIETAVQFGTRRQLAGILTEPSDRAPRAYLVLVSAGLVPKSGPHRLYTQLARRLAADGVATLRFDLGGIGDSVPSYVGPLRDRTTADLRAATDFLVARTPNATLAIGGLCSGAEDALRFAEHDLRIRAVMMIDPFAFRTSGWFWRHQVRRIWRRTLRALGLWAPLSQPGHAAVVDYDYMPHADAARALRALCDRRGFVHFLYTGGRLEQINHPDQLAAMFPTLPLREIVSVDHFPTTEHTQILQEDRDALVDTIVRRLTSRLAPVASRPR
jgi:hypothetical protein